MFSSLMPQRKEFFELLAAHSDRVVAGANAVLRLVDSLGDPAQDVAALSAEVDRNEKSADKIKAELIVLLHKSFTTPINRDQIHALTIELDNVINALQDVAQAVGMYSIKESTVEMREMASLAADACMRLNRAVIALADKQRTGGDHRPVQGDRRDRIRRRPRRAPGRHQAFRRRRQSLDGDQDAGVLCAPGKRPRLLRGRRQDDRRDPDRELLRPSRWKVSPSACGRWRCWSRWRSHSTS